MLPHCACVFVLLWGIATARPVDAGGAVDCPGERSDIVTDRPNVTNSSLAVPFDTLQIENGLTWTSRNRSNILDGSETRLRLGVARCSEVDLDVPNFFYSANGPSPSGFADLGMSVKRQLAPLPYGFSLAAIAGLTFPTGAKRISGRGYGPYLQFPWAKNLDDKWSVSGMFTVAWFTDQAQQNPTFGPSIAIGRSVTSACDATLEYAGTYDHQRPRQLLDTGAVYRITDRQQIDFQAGFGLNSSSLHHFFGLGYSIRIDDLLRGKRHWIR